MLSANKETTGINISRMLVLDYFTVLTKH